MYALLNVLPVLIAKVPMPDGIRTKLSSVVSQQDRVYQYAVQFEAIVPLVMLALSLRMRSYKVFTATIMYAMIFLRLRFISNYATHGLFTSVNNNIRQTLARIPLLLKVYSFVVGIFSRGTPNGVVTPNTLMESLQRSQQQTN